MIKHYSRIHPHPFNLIILYTLSHSKGTNKEGIHSRDGKNNRRHLPVTIDLPFRFVRDEEREEWGDLTVCGYSIRHSFHPWCLWELANAFPCKQVYKCNWQNPTKTYTHLEVEWNEMKTKEILCQTKHLEKKQRCREATTQMVRPLREDRVYSLRHSWPETEPEFKIRVG